MLFLLPHIFGIVRPRIDNMIYPLVADCDPLFWRSVIIPFYDGIINLVVDELD